MERWSTLNNRHLLFLGSTRLTTTSLALGLNNGLHLLRRMNWNGELTNDTLR
jgi:hypothetical protein